MPAGFGITRAQDIMHIAYISSLASTIQSARSIKSFAPYNTTDHILPDDSALVFCNIVSMVCAMLLLVLVNVVMP